jgi:hypothetical protein
VAPTSMLARARCAPELVLVTRLGEGRAAQLLRIQAVRTLLRRILERRERVRERLRRKVASKARHVPQRRRLAIASRRRRRHVARSRPGLDRVADTATRTRPSELYTSNPSEKTTWPRLRIHYHLRCGVVEADLLHELDGAGDRGREQVRRGPVGEQCTTAAAVAPCKRAKRQRPGVAAVGRGRRIGPCRWPCHVVQRLHRLPKVGRVVRTAQVGTEQHGLRGPPPAPADGVR